MCIELVGYRAHLVAGDEALRLELIVGAVGEALFHPEPVGGLGDFRQ